MKKSKSDEFWYNVAALIRDSRIAEGLTQLQLAEKAEITQQYVSKLENSLKNSGVSVRILKKIASVLNKKLEIVFI